MRRENTHSPINPYQLSIVGSISPSLSVIIILSSAFYVSFHMSSLFTQLSLSPLSNSTLLLSYHIYHHPPSRPVLLLKVFNMPFLLPSCRTHRQEHLVTFPHLKTHRSAISMTHTRPLPISSPLASPPLIRKMIHVPDPHFRHVGCLRCGDRLETVAVLSEAKCAVGGVAADDEA